MLPDGQEEELGVDHWQVRKQVQRVQVVASVARESARELSLPARAGQGGQEASEVGSAAWTVLAGCSASMGE